MAWETVAQRLRACVRVSSCLAAIPLALLLVTASAPVCELARARAVGVTCVRLGPSPLCRSPLAWDVPT